MKLPQIAATLVLGAACAMPAMAQSQGSGAPGKSSQPMSQPATQSSSADSTKAMGASPAQMDTGPSTQDTSRNTDKRDIGWLGLLGLAGLLGLRRKREDHHVHTEVHRTGTVR
jgi:MYXO-CTERM domain-containing protein